MPVSVGSYQTLEQMFAQAVSDEALDFIHLTTTKQLEVATSALDLYLGWFKDDMCRHDEKDKAGNVTSHFLDTLPDVDTYEPEDQAEQTKGRQENHLFEYYWKLNDKREPVQVSFYENAASMTSKGKEYALKVKALDQLLAKVPVMLNETDPLAYYNQWSPVEQATERSVAKKELNSITNMTRKAVHLWQQHKRLQGMMYFKEDPQDVSPGLRFDLISARDDDGTETGLARTMRPIVLTDSVARPFEQGFFSVSSFLSLDVAKATKLITQEGTTPLKALKLTLKRELGDTAQIKPVTIKANMLVEDAAAGIAVLNAYFDDVDRLKLFTTRMDNKRLGAALKLDMLSLFFDVLKPIMDQAPYHQAWLALKTAELEKDNKQTETEQRKDAIKQDIADAKTGRVVRRVTMRK